MSIHPILTDAQNRMKKSVDHTLHEFSTIHTGKASPAMVEGIMVEAYGGMQQLKACAAITTPDPRMIQVQPWDKGLLRAVEKALQQANIEIGICWGTLWARLVSALSVEGGRTWARRLCTAACSG